MNALRVPVRPLAPNPFEEAGRAGVNVPTSFAPTGLFAAELNEAEQRLAYHRPAPADGLAPAAHPAPETPAGAQSAPGRTPPREESEAARDRPAERERENPPADAAVSRTSERASEDAAQRAASEAKPARESERETPTRSAAERSSAENPASENAAALAPKERKEAGQRETKVAENDGGRRSIAAELSDKRSPGVVVRSEPPINERRLTEFTRLAGQLGRAHSVATKLDRPVLPQLQNAINEVGARANAGEIRPLDPGALQDLGRSGETGERAETRERNRAPVTRGATPASLEGKERVAAETRARHGGTAELVRLELDPEKWRVQGRIEGQAGREFSAAQSLTELSRGMKDRGGKGEQGSARDESMRSRQLNDMQTGQTGERARVGAERVFSLRDDASTRENSKLFNELVQKAVVNLRSDGGSTASIRMNPESLGSVTLNLQIHRTEVFAQVVVESDTARKLVSEELDRMRGELKAHGINVETVRISVREPASTGQMESQTQSDARQQDAAAGAQNGASGERQRSPASEEEHVLREGFAARSASAEYETSLDASVVRAQADGRINVQI